MSIRVVLADDQTLLRATFRLLLREAAGIDVVGEAQTGREAISVVRATKPDVVLMDIRMPDMDGIEAAEVISTDASLIDTRVLILTTFETDDLVLAAIRAGASGYLGKGVEPLQLLTAIETIASGESLLSPAATTSLIRRVLRSPREVHDAPLTGLVDDLTAREREVTALVARGLSNHEIGERLTITESTAKTHVNRAMQKVDARDRAQLVVFAFESGLMIPGTNS